MEDNTILDSKMQVLEHPDIRGANKRSMDSNFSSEMLSQVQCYT